MKSSRRREKARGRSNFCPPTVTQVLSIDRFRYKRQNCNLSKTTITDKTQIPARYPILQLLEAQGKTEIDNLLELDLQSFSPFFFLHCYAQTIQEQIQMDASTA